MENFVGTAYDDDDLIHAVGLVFRAELQPSIGTLSCSLVACSVVIAPAGRQSATIRSIEALLVVVIGSAR